MREVIFKIISVITCGGISNEIALRWMSLDLTDEKSILVQAMAWCHQATSNYLGQCLPRSRSQYGLTRPQWVNCIMRLICKSYLNSPLLTPYGVTDHGQHWFRSWLGAKWHQAKTWTNVDFLSMWNSYDRYTWNFQISNAKMCLKIRHAKPQFTGGNKLTHWGLVTLYGDNFSAQHWLRQWLVAWWH